MERLISVIIPNRNGGRTIRRCLEAVFASQCDPFEVIVVDDCSSDNSVAIISDFPCTLIRLDRHCGASRARNAGARASRGKVLFFTDADCILEPGTLSRAARALEACGPEAVIGGTYTPVPPDRDFFSRFQSAFIHYSETRQAASPDYIASHAMAMHREAFLQTGGFREGFLPMIEDVEYSHRVRKSGYVLRIDPAILVRHVFNFSLVRSLGNAARKTKWWVVYSCSNRDLLSDSGTASRGLKINVACYFLCLAWAAAAVIFRSAVFLVPVLLTAGAVFRSNAPLFQSFRKAGGSLFALLAYGYYSLVYPLPIAAGAVGGFIRYLFP